MVSGRVGIIRLARSPLAQAKHERGPPAALKLATLTPHQIGDSEQGHRMISRRGGLHTHTSLAGNRQPLVVPR